MKAPFYFGTNWKMQMGVAESRRYVSELLPLLKKADLPDAYLFVIPSFVSLQPVRDVLDASGVDLKLGAQNAHWEEGSEATGEIPVRMLREIPVDLVELGHSERRRKFGETDDVVNRKVRRVLEYELTALVCIGETLAEKEAGRGRMVLEAQIRAALEGVPAGDAGLGRVLLAYEPAWAIGAAGEPADPGYVGEQHAFVRGVLASLYGAPAVDVPLLYGGSVNHENFAPYVRQEHVDGLFVGRAAWTPVSFLKMAESIHRLLG